MPDLISIVPVPEQFAKHVDAALVRLRYLHPRVRFEFVKGAIEMSTEDGDRDRLRREVNYALYRERILETTMPLRRALIAGVMGR